VSADDNEVRHYLLTLDKAQRAATALQAINQLVAANPSLNAAMDASSGTTGKSRLRSRRTISIRSIRRWRRFIHQNGLATRDFIVIIGALFNDLAG